MDLRIQLGFYLILLASYTTAVSAKPPTLDNDTAEQAQEHHGKSAGAKFLSQVVPMTMDGGKSYPVVIQFRNTSGSGWSKNNGQRLIIRSANGARIWGVGRVEIDGGRTIPAEGTATFRFDITAPSQGGTYEFQWQLSDANGNTFGEATPPLKILVNPSYARGNANAEFVTQKISGLSAVAPFYTILEHGRPYKFSVMFKNNGNVAWNAPAFRLAAQNPAQNLTWTLDRVEISTEDNIKAGQFKAFNFTIITPVQPGIYALQWQMYREGVGFFGEPSENIAVTVR
ncbi:MAG: hypothetical protein OEW08_12240 [Gammaproteobacteria bacterium]|nr:hypothetical protein [Gammaproteobacteria bacterium]